MVRLILPMVIAGLLAWWWAYRRADDGGRSAHRRALWLIVAGIVVLLLWRVTGVHWLAAAGAGLFAVLRVLSPWLLRALPFLARFAPGRGGPAGQPPHAGDGGGGRRASGRGRMSRGHALEVMGLGPDATRAEITAQYRKLVRELHPDQGGSEFLTRQLNEARDVLLRS